MRRRSWFLAVIASLLLATVAVRADDRDAAPDAAGLLGPLRIRDMTPFNLLRLDMLPAHAVDAGRGSWAIEANLSFSNTFVMSENVRSYLGSRGGNAPLSADDVAAIEGMGEDAFYLDGEFALLETTFHYRLLRRTSIYLTVSAYDFTGGFMDGAIEGFHNTMGLDNAGRELVPRGQFQTVMALGGSQYAALDAPVDFGLGDPVIGMRQAFPLGASRWQLVLSGEIKVAWRGERSTLSTGTNDYGLQVAVQGKFGHRALYFNTSLVSTDGQVFGIPLERRVFPTVTLAYETALTPTVNFVGQMSVSPSTVQDSTIDLITADKYQASLGLRSRHGRLIYGFAVTENLKNFDNTPDIGMTASLAWVALKP